MKPRFKLTEVELETVREAMRALMIEQAKLRQTITYSELALRLPVYLHYHSFLFARLLNEIGEEEIKAGRGVLPAVVVRKSSGIPGGGYFGFAGREASSEDLERIWREELEIVFDYWHNHT
jgi:hypothetical protein